VLKSGRAYVEHMDTCINLFFKGVILGKNELLPLKIHINTKQVVHLLPLCALSVL
jgi:hypothetical protein